MDAYNANAKEELILKLKGSEMPVKGRTNNLTVGKNGAVLVVDHKNLGMGGAIQIYLKTADKKQIALSMKAYQGNDYDAAFKDAKNKAVNFAQRLTFK